MRFLLVDRVIELVPGERIIAVKNLSQAEEYLADHFPTFPVMPGVLMLETMTQAGVWLVRVSEDFAHAFVVLKEARNVKYANFVEPGQTLTMTAEIISQDDRYTSLKAQGQTSRGTAVSARLVLERYNLSDDDPGMRYIDEDLKSQMRKLFALVDNRQLARS